MKNLIPLSYFFDFIINIGIDCNDVFEYLSQLSDFLKHNIHKAYYIGYKRMGTSLIKNSYIEDGVHIGDFSLIRNSYVANGTTIGFSCEIARSVVMKNCMIPHHNFVGDSMLGNNVLIGGTVRFTNRRIDKKQIVVKFNNIPINSGLFKLGAVVGDNTCIGSGTVINPGTLIGKNCLIYPLLSVSGFLSSSTLLKYNIFRS